MIKKFRALVVAVVMFFSFAACKPPESEQEKMESRIKQDYFDKFCSRGKGGYKIKDVSLGYYGTYNGYVVVTMRLETGELNLAMPIPVDIAGFEFLYNTNYYYLVWKDGQFLYDGQFRWSIAYEQGILSQDDIRQMYNICVSSRTNEEKLL